MSIVHDLDEFIKTSGDDVFIKGGGRALKLGLL